MEPTTILERSVPESPSLWPIVLQALFGVLIIGDQVQERWATWDLMGKFMAPALLFGLVVGPAVELWRQRSGKAVRFRNLAGNAYTLVWIATLLFTRHSR
jgi:hypothetical protein